MIPCAQVFLYGDGYVLTAIASGDVAENIVKAELVFEAGYQGGISVFSNTTVSQGVTEEGLLYTLQGAVLTSDVALGVSNSFTKERALISVENGALIIIWYGNEAKPLPVHRTETEKQ